MSKWSSLTHTAYHCMVVLSGTSLADSLLPWKVAFNNILRRLWRLPRNCHTRILHKIAHLSGGFRNSERGVQSLARKARPQTLGLPRPLPVTLEVRTEYLQATLGLVKCLEISKELIRECVTMPGCRCMPLLHNHLVDSCTVIIMYAKIHYSPPKGGAFAPPLPPLNPPLHLDSVFNQVVRLSDHFSRKT